MISDVLFDLVTRCPNCSNYEDKLLLLTCGHSICGRCVEASASKCPLCDVDTLVLAEDHLFRDLSMATNYMNIVAENLPGFSSGSTMSDVEISNHLPPEPTTKDAQNQSFDRKTTKTKETQTDVVEAGESIPHNCQLYANLLRVMQQNTCDSFNALLNAFLASPQVLEQHGTSFNVSNVHYSQKVSSSEEPSQELVRDQPFKSAAILRQKDVAVIPNILMEEEDQWTREPVSMGTEELIPAVDNESAYDKESNDMEMEEVAKDKPKPRKSRKSSQDNLSVAKLRPNRIKVEVASNASSSPPSPAPVIKKEKENIEDTQKKAAAEVEASTDEDEVFRKPLRKRVSFVMKQLSSEDEQEETKSRKRKTKAEPSKTDSQKDGYCSGTSSDSSARSTHSRTSKQSRNMAPRYVILATNVESAINKKKLESASISLNFTLVEDWSESVTHIVTETIKQKGTKKGDLIAKRSIKYLQAVLAKKWIVSTDWIADSIRSNRLLDEAKYEIRAVDVATKMDCPKRSRTSDDSFFEGCTFFFDSDNLDSKHVQLLAGLQSLVTIGGGRLLKTAEEVDKCDPDTNLIIISKDSASPLLENANAKVMSVNNFLDCITNLSL